MHYKWHFALHVLLPAWFCEVFGQLRLKFVAVYSMLCTVTVQKYFGCYIKGINDVIECIKEDKEIDLKRINKRDMPAYLDGINTIFECINNNIDIDIDISTLRESIKKDIADNVVNYININIE